MKFEPYTSWFSHKNKNSNFTAYDSGLMTHDMRLRTGDCSKGHASVIIIIERFCFASPNVQRIVANRAAQHNISGRQVWREIFCALDASKQLSMPLWALLRVSTWTKLGVQALDAERFASSTGQYACLMQSFHLSTTTPPSLASLFMSSGSQLVLGSTPMALITKSAPYDLPLLRCTVTGHSCLSSSSRCALEPLLLLLLAGCSVLCCAALCCRVL